MNLYKADFKIYLRSAFSQNHKFYQHKKASWPSRLNYLTLSHY